MKGMAYKDLFENFIGKGIALLFILFLCLIGMACLNSAVQALFSGPFDPGGFIVAIIAGIAFGGIGLAMLYFIFLQEAGSALFLKYRQYRYGDRPWLLKRKWRKGRITYRPPSPVIFLWMEQHAGGRSCRKQGHDPRNHP
jgi:hypothetical protein